MAKKKENILHLKYHPDPEKYSKDVFIQVYRGYDFLENFLVVRSFIQRKYGIEIRMLELLLKLMGMKVFTRKQYSLLPKQFTFTRFKSIRDSGYVNLICDHTDVDQRLFALNTKGRNIVMNFYKYLSGEKKIPLDGAKNPMMRVKDQVAFDKKKIDLIKKMAETPIPEHTRKLFK